MSKKAKEKQLKQADSDSTTPTCSGLTPPTLPRRRVSPAVIVALVLRTPVSPPKSRQTFPMLRSFGLTSDSAPLVQPLPSKTGGAESCQFQQQACSPSASVYIVLLCTGWFYCERAAPADDGPFVLSLRKYMQQKYIILDPTDPVTCKACLL